MRTRFSCRFSCLVAACVIVLFSLVPTFLPAADQGSQQALKLTILHMNDPHGNYEPYSIKDLDAPAGGFGKAQTVMNGVEARNRTEGRETIRLMAGDLLMGTLYSTLFKGEVGVRLMNAMNFTAMVVGNHEFDYGSENLFRLPCLMSFPLLSANIKRGQERLFRPSRIKTFSHSSTRVFMIGLTTADTPQTTMPGNVKGLTFTDPVETAKEQMRGVRESDLVVALTHLGVDADERLARACPRIDVIIGGHSHTALKEPKRVGQTLICQAGANARFVGRLDLDVAEGRIVRHHGELIGLGPDIPVDAKVESILARYRPSVEGLKNRFLGETRVFLEGRPEHARTDAATNLGCLVGYLMATSAGAEAALLNGGSMRAGIQEGRVTFGDVHNAMPFMNTVVSLELTGADLVAVLQRSMDLPSGSGGKLQTYGMDLTRDRGRVTINGVGSRSFEPTAGYRVAINDFLLAGGDGYTLFQERGRDIHGSSAEIQVLLADYVKKTGVITQEALDAIR